MQRDKGLFGLVDPRRVLGQTKRDQARPQLVELAAARALRGDLGQRDQRRGCAHPLTILDRLAAIVEREPREPVAVAERAEVHAAARRRLGGEHGRHALPRGGERRSRCGDPLEVVLQRHEANIDSHPMDAIELFAPLAPTYDRYARLLSFGQDPRWRRFLVSRLEVGPEDTVLDVATGTAAVAIELVRRTGCRVVGLDQSSEMLETGRRRVEVAGLEERIELVEGTADKLPFADASFDGLTFTYLLRYVDDPAATMRELARVVRPGGTIAMLEFAVPRGLARPAWELYVRAGLPLLGATVSPGWRRVGSFLGDSIRDFHGRYDVTALWTAAGIEDIRARHLSLGGGLVMWGRRA